MFLIWIDSNIVINISFIKDQFACLPLQISSNIIKVSINKERPKLKPPMKTRAMKTTVMERNKTKKQRNLPNSLQLCSTFRSCWRIWMKVCWMNWINQLKVGVWWNKLVVGWWMELLMEIVVDVWMNTSILELKVAKKKDKSAIQFKGAIVFSIRSNSLQFTPIQSTIEIICLVDETIEKLKQMIETIEKRFPNSTRWMFGAFTNVSHSDMMVLHASDWMATFTSSWVSPDTNELHFEWFSLKFFKISFRYVDWITLYDESVASVRACKIISSRVRPTTSINSEPYNSSFNMLSFSYHWVQHHRIQQRSINLWWSVWQYLCDSNTLYCPRL